jgi:phosphatidylglycerol:prolipoprotein diacylglycerol transferase
LYPAIQIGQMLLPTLGVVVVLGWIAAVTLAVARAPTYGIGRATVFVAASAALLLCVFGERVANNFLLAWLGRTVPSVACAAGIALAALGIPVWSHMSAVRFSALADCLSQPIALALAMERFGCFLAGSACGRPTDCPWGVVFNNALALAWYRTPIGIRLHPTQLYECFLAVLLFCLLQFVERYKVASGVPILTLVAGYAFGRYFIEFLRGDVERGFWGPLSVPQWICALVLLVSVILLTMIFRPKAAAAREALIMPAPQIRRSPRRLRKTAAPPAHKHS